MPRHGPHTILSTGDLLIAFTKGLDRFFAMITISLRDIAITVVIHVLPSVFHSPVKGRRVQSLSMAVFYPHERFLAHTREQIVALSPMMLLTNVVLTGIKVMAHICAKR